MKAFPVSKANAIVIAHLSVDEIIARGYLQQ